METMLNPYEQQRIRIKGEGYFESIVFEDLPQDREDEALFGDCVINKRRRVKFYIRNTSDETIRFVWTNEDARDFEIRPSVGHLQPNSRKILRAYFFSDQ